MKIIEFGKIDFLGCGKKINLVTLEVELRGEKKPTLSVCGNVWNAKKTDIIIGGQCLDELLQYFKNNILFMEIYRLWKDYHLNDLHAGTKKQENFLIKNNVKNWANNYEETCEFLSKNNLLYDKGVKFGEKWHYWAIPKKDLKKIEKIIKNDYKIINNDIFIKTNNI